MSKRLITALILLILAVVVLVLNTGEMRLNLIFGTIRAIKAIAMLGFLVVGIVIGLLIK